MTGETGVRLAHMVADGDTSGLFRRMARRHDRERFDLEFITLRDPEPGFREALEAMDLPLRSAGTAGRATWPLAVLRLAWLLRRRRVQILHTHLFEPSVVGLTAGYLARVPVRIVTRHHSDYHTRLDATVPVLLDRLCTRLAHGVIAVSEHTREVMVREEGAPPGKVRVIANGLDPDRVRQPSPARVASLRRKLRGERAACLLVPARLHPEKGHEHFFQALKRLLEKGRSVRACLAGSGSHREPYRRRLVELDLEDDVTFLGHRPDVIALMAAADVVVIPSVAEAFGLVALEARAVGAPLVCTRAGGLPELVRHGRDGLLVPPGDPDAMADAIERLLVDAELRKRMAKPDRSLVDRFSFDRMVEAYECYYEELWNDR